MSFSIPDCFMISFAVGFFFGLVYEALRIVRLILRVRPAIFICDVLFFVLAAGAILKLSDSLGNYVRIYTVLGFGAGVFAYIVTVGRILNLAESAASVVWRKTIGRFLRFIGRKMKKAFGIIAQKISSIFGGITKYLDNQKENRAKHLQLNHKPLYNKKRLDKIGESEEVHVIKATVRKSS